MSPLTSPTKATPRLSRMTSPRGPCCTASSSTAAPTLGHQTTEAEYELTEASTDWQQNSRRSQARPSRTARRPAAALGADGRPARRGRRVLRLRPAAALRRAEAYHHDLEILVPHIVGQHRLDDAEDLAAILRYRLDKSPRRLHEVRGLKASSHRWPDPGTTRTAERRGPPRYRRAEAVDRKSRPSLGRASCRLR